MPEPSNMTLTRTMCFDCAQEAQQTHKEETVRTASRSKDLESYAGFALIRRLRVCWASGAASGESLGGG